MNTLNKVAEVKLSYKTNVKASDRIKIGSSIDVVKILKDSWDEETIEYTESFKVLLLNRCNNVLGITTISNGGVTGTVVDIKMILQAAILSNSSSIILSHNHPSGNLKPSEQDKEITSKIIKAAKIMDISCLDHIIITSESYFSFADEGIMY